MPLEKKLLISASQINKKLQDIAHTLNQNYREKEVVIITVLKGSLIFTADLIRLLSFPVIIQTITCKSYGMSGKVPGKLEILGLDTLDVMGKDILIVEDIFDSGNTLASVAKELQYKKPKTLTTLTLLHKKIKRETSFLPDYSLFEIENKFVIGYGLDYKELHRNLPDIYEVL